LPIFDPKIRYNPLSPPILCRCISARLFSVPKVENEVKRLHFADVAEIQEAVTDELKKVQKEEFSAAFRNSTTTQKPVELILNKKSCVPLIFKKISPKTFGPHCVY
jgi:hypothetical protein